MGFAIVERMTRAQFDAGAGIPLNNVTIEITDAAVGTTWQYDSGAAGVAPTPASGSSAATASAGTVTQVTATNARVQFTQATLDAGGTIVHLNEGVTGLDLVATDWTANRFFHLTNVGTASISVTVGAGWTRARTPALSKAAGVTGDLLSLQPGDWALVQMSNGYLNVVEVSGAGGRMHQTWTAATWYEKGEAVYANAVSGTIGIGDLIIRNTSGTSGASFDATEAALWTEAAHDPDLVKTADIRAAFTYSPTDAAVPSEKLMRGVAVRASNPLRGFGLEDAYQPAYLHLKPEAITEAAGAAVPSWANAALLNNPMAQSNALGQAKVSATALNSLKVLEFDGTSDQYENTGLSATLKPAAFIVVAKPATGSTGIRTFIGGATNGSLQFALTAAGNLKLTHQNTVEISASTAAVTLGSWGIYVATYDAAGAWTFRLNGAASGSGTNSVSIGASIMMLGGRGSEYFQGDIAEVVALDYVPSVAVLEAIEGALAHKFALTGNLPVAHVYKSASPTAMLDAYAAKVHTHSIADSTNLQTSLDAKQATLVSGTNIKTVNGGNIVGSGNLTVIAPIAITINGAAGAGTNYPVKLIIGESAGAAGTNFNVTADTFPTGKNSTASLIFWDANGNVPFWIEAVSGTTPNRAATVWVKPSIDLTSSGKVYMSANASDAIRSDGAAVFALFDDFDGSTLDATKWNTGAISGHTFASGILSFGGGNVGRALKTLNTFGDGFEVMAVMRASDTAASTSNFGWDSATDTEDFRYDNVWSTPSRVMVGTTANTLTTNIDNGVGVRQLMRIARSGGAGKFSSENPANTFSVGTGVPTAATAVTVYNTYDNSTEVDWVIIRKYVTTEPSFKSAALLEAMPWRGVKVGLSAAQSLTNATGTTVAWTSDFISNASMHSTATNNSRLTVPIAGKYRLTINQDYAANATGRRVLSYSINGGTTEWIAGVPASSGGEEARFGASTVLALNANDYIEVGAFQSSGVALNLLAGAGTFAILEYIGA